MALLQPPSTTILQNKTENKKKLNKTKQNKLKTENQFLSRECKTLHHRRHIHTITENQQHLSEQLIFIDQVNDSEKKRIKLPTRRKKRMEKHFQYSSQNETELLINTHAKHLKSNMQSY